MNIRELLTRKFETLNLISLSQSALDNNIAVLKQLSGSFLIPVLKSNAYGHGLEEVSKMMKGHSFPYMAVDGYFEALTVNKINPKQDILVLGAIHPSNTKKLDRKFTYVVFNEAMIKAFGRTKKEYKVHLELDTGMRRHGTRPEELESILALLKSYPNLKLTGVMSHLADADNPESDKYNNEQIKLFDKLVEQVFKSGFNPECIHIAQSAGMTRKKSKFANTVRPGIAIFGISPLSQSDDKNKKLKDLKPILKLTSKIGAIQHLKKGDKISYGLIYTAPEDMDIGVLPLGYHEILPRELSNKTTFLHKGKEVKQVGRICMNHTMIEASELELGSKITVISDNTEDANSIYSLRKLANIFEYEFLVNIAPSIRREITR